MEEHDPIDDVIETKYFPGTDRVERMLCRVCRSVLFDDAKDRNNVPLALHGLVAHMSIQHGIYIHTFEFSDPGCLKPHEGGSA